MCEHTSIRCSLIQTIDGYHREDICTSCKHSNACVHFDLGRSFVGFEPDYHAVVPDGELVLDEYDSKYEF